MYINKFTAQAEFAGRHPDVGSAVLGLPETVVVLASAAEANGVEK